MRSWVNCAIYVTNIIIIQPVGGGGRHTEVLHFSLSIKFHIKNLWGEEKLWEFVCVCVGGGGGGLLWEFVVGHILPPPQQQELSNSFQWLARMCKQKCWHILSFVCVFWAANQIKVWQWFGFMYFEYSIFIECVT